MTTEIETTAAARAEFERHEAETQSLTPEEVGRELDLYLWGVTQTMNPGENEDPYIVQHSFTLKGLRWHLAAQRYLETLLPPEDDDDTATAQTDTNAPDYLTEAQRHLAEIKALFQCLNSAAEHAMNEGDDDFIVHVLAICDIGARTASAAHSAIDYAGMAARRIGGLCDLQARAAYLAETCDGGLTFKAELEALARDIRSMMEGAS